MDKALPVLPSLDLERTRKFYRYFGFEPVDEPAARDDEITWLRLKREEVELYFSLTSVDYRQEDNLLHQSIAVISVGDVHRWHDIFAKTRMGWKWIYPSLTAPRNDMWGGRWAFALTDRDGNLIWCIEDRPAPEKRDDPLPAA